MDCSRRKKNKILRADDTPLTLDLQFCLPLKNEESLFQVRVDVGVCLPPEFDLSQDDFHAIRT